MYPVLLFYAPSMAPELGQSTSGEWFVTQPSLDIVDMSATAVFNGFHKLAVAGLGSLTIFGAYTVGAGAADIMGRKWERDRIAAEAEATQARDPASASGQQGHGTTTATERTN